MQQQGWVCIHRSLLENFVWNDKPFNMGAAWVDLILLANHDEKKLPVDGRVIKIKRGQTFTSCRSLATRWGWSLGKVKRFVDMLEHEQMVITKRSKNGTLLTLVKYDIFQDARNTNGTLTERRRNTDGTLTERNNNDNNENNENKNNYAEMITQIFDYLNQKTGKHYTGRSEAHRKHIIARLKEGYTVEEFKRVIDNKVAAWKYDERMSTYLRPETLFGTKFETYLNDTETKAQKEKRETDELHERQIEAIRANELDWLYHQT